MWGDGGTIYLIGTDRPHNSLAPYFATLAAHLFDTAKDTDGLVLEITPGSSRVFLDFNYAYNASCAYSPLWACPLAPPENFLRVPVTAGEKNYKR